jgi:hypothetical protein
MQPDRRWRPLCGITQGGKTMKKLVAFALAIVLFATMTSTAFASDLSDSYSSVPTEGTPAKGGIGSAEGSADYSALDVDFYVEYWRNSIQEIASGYLRMYGYTKTNIVADKIENDYYLQQWNGSAWVTYSTSYNYVYDEISFTLNIYRYVSSGYYYRVKTIHRGWLDTSYDSETLYSSYIYVS